MSTRHGAITEADRIILEHLEANPGGLTTAEISEDTTLGRRTYARLVRLDRLGYVDKLKVEEFRSVLWARSGKSRP